MENNYAVILKVIFQKTLCELINNIWPHLALKYVSLNAY